MNNTVSAPANADQMVIGNSVFLGGSCDPTTWRQDVAIPRLAAAGVSYVNPQVPNYDELNSHFVGQGFANGLADVEQQAKDQAKVLIFVIDSQTRAIASMIEAAARAARGEKVILVTMDVAEGSTITKQTITGGELKDLNRGRKYLRAETKSDGAIVCDSVEEAVETAIKLINANS